MTRYPSEYVFDLAFEDIPKDAVDRTGDLLLDTLAVAAASHDLPAGRIARETAANLYGTGDAALPTTGAAPLPAGRMLFDGREVSVAGACFAAATQIDNLDAHDGYQPVKGHAGVALVPALIHFADLAAKQGRAVSGREAITTLAMGYDIACRAGAALHGTVQDYHTSGAWNALGVAAIGARLLGLTRDQLREAWGIAEYHGPRSQMMRGIAHPTMVHDGSGWGAMTGASAVALARNGFTGAPAITVESEDVAEYWRTLGEDFLVTQQYIKPHPVCFWAQSVVTGALNLRREHGFEAEDIERAEIATFHESAQLSLAMPQSTEEAQYSMAFPVACALIRGRCGIDEIAGSGLADSRVEEFLNRVAVREEEAYSKVFPGSRLSALTLQMKGGGTLETGPLEPRGSVADPLARVDIVEKFFDYAEPLLGLERTTAIEQGVLELADGAAFNTLLADLLITVENFEAEEARAS